MLPRLFPAGDVRRTIRYGEPRVGITTRRASGFMPVGARATTNHRRPGQPPARVGLLSRRPDNGERHDQKDRERKAVRPDERVGHSPNRPSCRTWQRSPARRLRVSYGSRSGTPNARGHGRPVNCRSAAWKSRRACSARRFAFGSRAGRIWFRRRRSYRGRADLELAVRRDGRPRASICIHLGCGAVPKRVHHPYQGHLRSPERFGR